MTKWSPSYPNRVRRHGLILTNHAIERMAERQLYAEQIKQVIEAGQFEYEYKGLIRYSFARHLTHPRRLAWAQERALDDLVILVAKKKGCIVTAYRESDPDPVFADLFPKHVPPPNNPDFRGRKIH